MRPLAYVKGKRKLCYISIFMALKLYNYFGLMQIKNWKSHIIQFNVSKLMQYSFIVLSFDNSSLRNSKETFFEMGEM